MQSYLLAITKDIPGETKDIYINAENMQEAIKKAAENEITKELGIEKIEISEIL